MFKSNKRECLKVQKCAKVKNPCKICLETVTEKNGLRCQGACRKWAHFKCLNYTPGKIQDIKTGYIKVSCPCPNCDANTKETQLIDAPKYCGKSQCPARKVPECEVPACPAKACPAKSCPEDCPPAKPDSPCQTPPEPTVPDCCKSRRPKKSLPRCPIIPPPCPIYLPRKKSSTSCTKSPPRKKSPPCPITPPPCPPKSPPRKKSPPSCPNKSPPRKKSPPSCPVTPPPCPPKSPKKPRKVDRKSSPCCSPTACLPVSSPCVMSPVVKRSEEVLSLKNEFSHEQLIATNNEPKSKTERTDPEEEKESKLRQFLRYCSEKAARQYSNFQIPLQIPRKRSESVLTEAAGISQPPPPYTSNPDIPSPKRGDSASRHKQIQCPAPMACPSHLSTEEKMPTDQPCYEFGQNMPSFTNNDKQVGIIKIHESTNITSKCSSVARIPVPTRQKSEIVSSFPTRQKAENVSSFPSIGKYYATDPNFNEISSVVKPSKSDSHLKCSDPRKMLLSAVERMYDTMGQFQNQFRDLMSKMITALEKCS